MKKIYAIILSFGLILAPVQHAKAEMSWGGIPNMVMGISTGIIGSTVLVHCKMGAANPSLWAFMGGSLAFILAEISGANALQAHIKAETFNVDEAKAKLQEGDTAQRIALEQQLQSEKTKLEFVKKRKGWMYAVGVLYLAATTFAILEAAAVIATLGTYTGLGGCTGYKEITVLNGILRSVVILAFTGGSLNSAGANGWVSLGGGVLGGLMLITPVGKFMETVVGAALETAVGRSITFGVYTALTTAAIVDLEITQTKIEKNIDDINLVLSTQYPPPPGGGFQAGPGTESTENNVSTLGGKNSLKKLDGFYAITPAACASNSDGSFSVNSGNCKKPMKITRPNLSGSLTSNTLQTTANMAADYTNALAAGNMARAEVLAGSLSNMAGRLKLEKDAALKKYNTLAKQNKKKTLDFDKEVKAMTASMSASLSKSLASQGIDPSNLNKASSGAEKKQAVSIAATPQPAVSSPEIPIEDLGTATETPAEETAEAPAPTLEESLENFESSESDISPQKQVSIFKQVSNRYILNYNRFFKEEESTPEAPPIETKAPIPESPVTQPVK